jgi:hypothetical protein
MATTTNFIWFVSALNDRHLFGENVKALVLLYNMARLHVYLYLQLQCVESVKFNQVIVSKDVQIRFCERP